MTVVANVLESLILCFLVHEGGHYLAALFFGRKLRFRRTWGKYCIPRYVWDMPALEWRKQRIIAAAGFAAEAVVSGILAVLGWPWMGGAFVVHVCAYPFYADSNNDFLWF